MKKVSLVFLFIFLYQIRSFSYNIDLGDNFFSMSCMSDKNHYLQFREILEASNETYRNDEFVLISLGDRCTSAYQIQMHGWRKAAFPFDWNITPVNALIQLLDDNFQLLLDSTFLTPHPVFKHAVLHSEYNITFAHDFPIHEIVAQNNQRVEILNENWLESFPQIKDKYMRRIKRFNDLASYAGKVFFIHTIYEKDEPITLESAIRIKQNLQKKFPILHFDYVVIEIGKKVTNWEIDENNEWLTNQIHKFQIYEFGFYSPITQQIYKEIFEFLGVPKK